MYFSFPLTPDKLTAAEQLIIEYITGHRDEFLCMTIGQLSDELNLSEATNFPVCPPCWLLRFQTLETDHHGANREKRSGSKAEKYAANEC